MHQNIYIAAMKMPVQQCGAGAPVSDNGMRPVCGKHQLRISRQGLPAA